jgi:hypothetical protein
MLPPFHRVFIRVECGNVEIAHQIVELKGVRFWGAVEILSFTS